MMNLKKILLFSVCLSICCFDRPTLFSETNQVPPPSFEQQLHLYKWGKTSSPKRKGIKKTLTQTQIAANNLIESEKDEEEGVSEEKIHAKEVTSEKPAETLEVNPPPSPTSTTNPTFAPTHTAPTLSPKPTLNPTPKLISSGPIEKLEKKLTEEISFSTITPSLENGNLKEITSRALSETSQILTQHVTEQYVKEDTNYFGRIEDKFKDYNSPSQELLSQNQSYTSPANPPIDKQTRYEGTVPVQNLEYSYYPSHVPKDPLINYPFASTPREREPYSLEREYEDSQDYCCQQTYCDNSFSLQTCRLEFGAVFGQFIGLREGYSELEIFAATPVNDDLHLFVDGREFFLDHRDWAASIGVGFRKKLNCCCDVFGANVFYDFRESTLDQDWDCDLPCTNAPQELSRSFNRIGLGLELFTGCLDSRLNFYIPIGRTSQAGQTISLDFPTGASATYQNKNFLRYGLDFEVGKAFCLTNSFSSYAAVGTYYYDHRDLESIYGPQARLELWWRDYVKLQLRYSYDREFQSGYQGEVLFSIPLESFFDCCCEFQDLCVERMNQSVFRNFVPFIDKRSCWNWNW